MDKLIKKNGEFVYLAIAENMPKEKQEITASREILEGLYATWLKLAKYEDVGTVEDIEIITKKAKEKDPIEHIADKDILIGNGKFKKGTRTYYCGKCTEFISRIDNYCRICGQKINWN